VDQTLDNTVSAVGDQIAPSPGLRVQGRKDAPEDRGQFRAKALALVPPLALAALAVVLTTRGIGNGDFRYSDASRHAMDGVFIYDFVRDLPGSLSHPLDYAIEYYAHYPALGIVLYYPPFFAIVEAAFFAVFGISPFTARLTVVAFAVLAVVMGYKLLGRIADRKVAFLSMALFISLPAVVFWSRQVMLEMPTTAMILTAAYFFLKYTELGRPRDAIWAALATVAAVMTKQPALFIVPAFAVYLVVRRRWDLLRRWEAWAGTGIVAVALGPYFVLSFLHTHLLTHSIGTSRFFDDTVPNLVGSFAEALSLPLAVAAVATAIAVLVWEWRRSRRPGVWLLAVLVVVFFAESVYLGAALPRYVLLGVPFVVCFIPLLLDRTGLLERRAVLGAAALGVLAMAAASYAQPVPVKQGYREATASILARNDGRPFFLFDGFRDGDVVFYTRQMAPSENLYVLRGNKMLYTFASAKRFGYQEFITTREGLVRFIHDYGIRVVAVEDRDLADTQPGRLLREVLKDPDLFECVDTIPIRAPESRLDGLNVLVYVSRNGKKSTRDFLTIPLPGLQRILTVPVDGKGRPEIIYAPWNDKE
jgi:hypothetical protein